MCIILLLCDLIMYALIMYEQQEPDQGHTSKGYTYINYCPEGCDLVTVTVIIAYSMTVTLACCKPDNPPLQGIGL